MPTVVPVKFKFSAKNLWFDPSGIDIHAADHVICTTQRGTEIGIAVGDPYDVSQEELTETIGESTLLPVVRIATPEDMDLAETLSNKAADAFELFQNLADQSSLDMKPVGVEYLMSQDKVVCYFVAKDRIDFRQLVRDLTRELHEHIDMRQIGVREQSALVGGYAHCGQELCCVRFGKGFDSVSVRMAKEQDLPLNASKISGACGRLMCCLRYEFETYRDFKKHAPKHNALISTPLGTAKVVDYNTPKEEIGMVLEDGKRIVLSLADMDTNHKKGCSKEAGCGCRPNSVSRSVLLSLNSPEIQDALAQIDAKYEETTRTPKLVSSEVYFEQDTHNSK